jgi:hypothetical protein
VVVVKATVCLPVVALERLLRRVQLLDVVGEVGAGAKVSLLAHPEHGRGWKIFRMWVVYLRFRLFRVKILDLMDKPISNFTIISISLSEVSYLLWKIKESV